MNEFMRELNFPHKLIELLRMSAAPSKYLVKIREMISDPFEARAGVKQGGVIAPLLFNIMQEVILRKAIVDTKKNIIRNMLQILAYADVIVILIRDLD